MKLLTVAVLISIAVGSGSASAQTCAAPIPLQPLITSTGNTCTAQNELGTLCIFALSPSNDVIYTVNFASFIDPGDPITLINNTPAWNAALVLIDGACNGDSTCPRTADAGGPGENETLDPSGFTTGTYFLVVTSTASDTSCGSYSLVASDFVPVELQSFEID